MFVYRSNQARRRTSLTDKRLIDQERIKKERTLVFILKAISLSGTCEIFS